MNSTVCNSRSASSMLKVYEDSLNIVHGIIYKFLLFPQLQSNRSRNQIELILSGHDFNKHHHYLASFLGQLYRLLFFPININSIINVKLFIYQLHIVFSAMGQCKKQHPLSSPQPIDQDVIFHTTYFRLLVPAL